MARWTRVLDAFAERGEWGIRDLARESSIPRSAVHRIVTEMASVGLLTADGDGRYSIGPDLARIGILVAGRVDVRRVGRPILERVAAEIGETVVLALYDPSRRQFSAVDAVETSHPIRYIWESLQDWSDVHLGSSGKGILAFLPESERDAILASLPDPIPGRRPISQEALRRELALARERGWVISHGERYDGAIGVSAPIRDAAGRVIGDLIGTWPDNRTNATKEADAATSIKRGADELSRRLGWAGG
jgi:IclR family acetate operon transcriptional repressor